MRPCPGYYKQCCDEHWGTCVSFNSGFLGVYAVWVILDLALVLGGPKLGVDCGCLSLPGLAALALLSDLSLET